MTSGESVQTASPWNTISVREADPFGLVRLAIMPDALTPKRPNLQAPEGVSGDGTRSVISA